jgi:quinolinate synthase
MAMNGLKNLAETLERGTNEIHIDLAAGQKALKGIHRMLDFAQARKAAIAAPTDAQYGRAYAHGMGPA